MHWIADTVRYYLLAWGYGAIVVGLVGEDSGLPLPGETVLFFASFLAYKGEYFSLPWVILMGIASSATGDNLGYLFGRKAGRKLIEHWKSVLHIRELDLAEGEELMRRHGSLAIFLARWIWGFRIMAGPLAGILEMAWTKFTIFNLLGAATWACTIASIGYLFGRFTTIYSFFEKADLTLTAAIAILSIYWWHRYRKNIGLGTKRTPRQP
ncbi:MAG TPA: DedA family protein [Patescibacteria group bacterium]|nr:DedA family protein [Patescibacteria group bacterium]